MVNKDFRGTWTPWWSGALDAMLSLWEPGFSPWWGTETPHAVQHGQKKGAGAKGKVLEDIGNNPGEGKGYPL